MTTAETYTTKRVNKALKGSGYASLKQCVAKLSTEGCTLTKIAKKLGLNPKRFSAYYYQWCRDHAEPLRLSEDTNG